MRTLAKDFHKLQKNITSFSNGEARVTSFGDELTNFEVELNIKDGFYKDGIFTFAVNVTEHYPEKPPTVTFKSPIFHPNIGDGYDNEIVCLNLLSEDWQMNNDLEDVVQGMLFLVKNPALDDALNPLFCELDDEFEEGLENFAGLVRQSLEGGIVEGVVFERNPGLGEEDKMSEEVPEAENNHYVSDIDPETPETTKSTTDNKNLALVVSENSPFTVPGTVMIFSSKDELCRCGLYWVYNNFLKFSTNGEMVCQKGGCPKWLVKLAALMFSIATKRTKNNIFLRNLRTFRRFPYFNRTLMWNTK